MHRPALNPEEPEMDHDQNEWAERVNRFADPYGNSALHVAHRGNPRNLPCPTCKEPNRLTRADKTSGYQCNACADRDEGRGYGL